MWEKPPKSSGRKQIMTFFTDPLILEPPGEMYIQPIKIPLNLVIIIIKSPTGFPLLLSHDYITVWYLMGGKGQLY